MKFLRFARLWTTRHRTLVLGVLSAGVCFMLGFLMSHELPKLRSFILVKIEEASRDHLPVRILPGRIDVSFVPLGATLSKVRILAKPEIADVFEQAAIDRVSVTVSPWLLLSGRLRLSSVEVEGAQIDASIPPSKKKSGAPLEGLFDTIAKIPLNRIDLIDVGLRLRVMDPKLNVQVSDLNLTAEKKFGGALYLGLNSGSAQVTEPESKTTVRIDAETHLRLARNSIEIMDFNVRRGESALTLSGELAGDTEKLRFDSVDMKADTDLHLESLRNWAIKRLKDYSKLPPMKGHVTAKAEIRREKSKPIQADFDVRGTNLGLMKMTFGTLNAKGNFENNTAHIPSVTIENPSGVIRFDDLNVNVAQPRGFSGRLKTTNLQLHELLKALGVGAIPVWLQASGDIPCTGVFEPFKIDCKGSLQAENLLVRDEMKSRKTIVAIRKMIANGDVQIDANKVTYHTDLQTPNSKGKSDGEIGYDEGFKINYETERLDFKDVANLADLRIEGAAKIKGSTEGDSHAASLSMDMDGTDVWFEDFWLGQPHALVGYKSGALTFANLAGHYTVSRYNGDVKVDLRDQTIAVNGRVPFFDTRDLLKVFSRRVKLPFAVTGTGQATIKASGPLQLNHLSYDLKSSVFKGTVSGETFDQAHFDVKSESGEVRTERVDVIKGPSTITLSGTGHPDGKIKTRIQGRGVRIEDSVIVASTGLNLSGNVDFEMKMEGPVLEPDTDMQGKVTNTTIGEHGMPDSEFALKFRSTSIEGSGSLIGNTVKTSFVIPFDVNSPFALKLNTIDWNYTPVFAALAGTNARKDYDGHLTTTIDIGAPTGGLWNATGTARVDKFSLARGALQLATTEPARMSMKAGQVHVEKFDLSGDGVYLRVNDSPNPVNKLDLQVNGKIDMSLLAILTPFLEDLRGILSFAFNFRSGPSTTELLGSAYIDKAFVKIYDFPHPLENIQADLLFNQRKILFNTIKAELGGGRLNGTGGLELKGYKNYPINIAGTFDKVTFNIPDKIRTTGSGTLSFTGNWFPFVLKADYEIKEGLATKDFGGEGMQGDGIRRDFFLPELLLAENFTPVLLDMNINFNRGIAVKNELIEGRVLGSLSVRGKPSKPALLGAITTDKETRIIVKDTSFEIQNSNIQFNDPNEVNPRLYVSARARKNEYDITLLVQGTASAPALSFTSVPPLAEKDIISLLAIGSTENQTTTTIATKVQGSDTALNAGSGVMKKNPVTNLIKDSIGFDVQFSPGFDETGSSAVQKIIASRQFNQRFDVTASRSIGGKLQETQARARYRLNDRVSVVGSWLGRDYTETQTLNQSTTQNPNAFGLDLEYKFEFK